MTHRAIYKLVSVWSASASASSLSWPCTSQQNHSFCTIGNFPFAVAFFCSIHLQLLFPLPSVFFIPVSHSSPAFCLIGSCAYLQSLCEGFLPQERVMFCPLYFSISLYKCIITQRKIYLIYLFTYLLPLIRCKISRGSDHVIYHYIPQK